jgi:hypothetical protein
MFKVKGGWMVPMDAFFDEEEYDESMGDADAFYENQAEEASKFKEDNYGNRFRREHAMFRMNRPDEDISGPYTGNEGAKREFWYYAAAVVVSVNSKVG